MNKDNAIGFCIVLLTGAIIGGAIALFYAPQSGKKTRKFLKNKAAEFVDEVKEEASDVMDTVKKIESEVNRKGKTAVKAISS